MTRSLSNKRVTPGDEVFHDALERILQFGREKGKDHPVAVNTTVAILDALIALSDIEERDARQGSYRHLQRHGGSFSESLPLPSCHGPYPGAWDRIRANPPLS